MLSFFPLLSQVNTVSQERPKDLNFPMSLSSRKGHFWPQASHCGLMEMFSDDTQEPLTPLKVKNESFNQCSLVPIQDKNKNKTQTLCGRP